jgi:hypothetical protein
MPGLTREDIVQKSVETYCRAAVYEPTRGFAPGFVEFVESFNGMAGQLATNMVAVGFNFDQEPQQAELGSLMRLRQVSIEFFVFGKTNTEARNIANVVKEAAERDLYIPLLDFTQESTPATGEVLEVIGARTERQVIPKPDPWEEFVYATTVHVEDTYDAALA